MIDWKNNGQGVDIMKRILPYILMLIIAGVWQIVSFCREMNLPEAPISVMKMWKLQITDRLRLHHRSRMIRAIRVFTL